MPTPVQYTYGFTILADGNTGVWLTSSLAGHIYFSHGGTHADVGPPPDVWERVDVRDYGIPANVKAIEVQGILIVTAGVLTPVTGIGISFRRPNDAWMTDPRQHYQLQAMCTGYSGGRTNGAILVTPVNGIFEYGWWKVGEPGWPMNASFGLNMTIQKWMR